MFGALEIEGQGTSEEYALTQEVTTLGRAPGNDLCLDHATVSRFHAKILSGESGSRVVDLGSGNGTRVDGVELEAKIERPLANGSLVQIGPFNIYFLEPVVSAPERVEDGPEASRAAKAGPTIVVRAPTPARLMVATPRGTTEFPLAGNRLTLGREPSNDISIDSDAVSRRHARLEKRASGWEITDLDSTNGLRFRGKPVQSMPLANGDVVYVGRSVALEYREAEAEGPRRQQQIAEFELPMKGAMTLGRSDNADVTFMHPLVSQVHAQVVRRGADFYVEDLGSSNGTFVNGRLIKEHRLDEGDVVRIGSSRLVLRAGRLQVVDEAGNLRIDAFHLSRVAGKGLRILQDVSLSIYPQEFVAIVGASGSGKSTLLNALCGFRPANAGTVLLNGIDLYQNFGAYRNDLGYVPQDDIIHRELPVYRALDYAARLRMPGDTTTEERRRRVEEVIDDLDLRVCVGRAVRQLSGGQRKRVSIGVELLTRPSLFFLDEATSGLDPGTESQMMKLLRRLADQGRTVALVTHATKNVMTCDKVVFLARGGHLAYYGPPEDALHYFGVGDFDEIYNRLEKGEPKDWSTRFFVSKPYRENVEARLCQADPAFAREGGSGAASARSTSIAPPAVEQRGGTPAKPRQASGSKQFVILCKRYLDTIWCDKKTLVLLFALAPLLGLIDFVVWKRNLFDPVLGSSTQTVTMFFFAAVICILVGTIASMREIVKEDAVYRRERMVGLRVLPYVGSKVAIGFLFALYSACMLFLFKVLAINFTQLSTRETMMLLVPIVLATFAGVMWGLLVSAVAPSEERAVLLVILVLVPQIVFGGMVPLEDMGTPGKVISWVTSTRWEVGALATQSKVESGPGVAADLSDVYLPGIESLKSPEAKQQLITSLHHQAGAIFHVNVALYWGMAFVVSLILLGLVALLQKRKDNL